MKKPARKTTFWISTMISEIIFFFNHAIWNLPCFLQIEHLNFCWSLNFYCFHFPGFNSLKNWLCYLFLVLCLLRYEFCSLIFMLFFVQHLLHCFLLCFYAYYIFWSIFQQSSFCTINSALFSTYYILFLQDFVVFNELHLHITIRKFVTYFTYSQVLCFLVICC